MQFGITIPLQKFLRWKTPAYGEPENLFFCWDLHVIRYHGENTLMAVNASNAFTVILWKMEWADWEKLEGKVLEAIRRGLLTVGYSEETVEAYFRAAGKVQFTKTHGRRPVAALNRMTDFLQAAPMKIEEDRQFQPAVCRFVNGNVLKTAGAETKGRPEVFLGMDMEKNGVVSAQADCGECMAGTGGGGACVISVADRLCASLSAAAGTCKIPGAAGPGPSPAAAGSGPSPSAADPSSSPSAAGPGSSPSAADPGPSPSAADPSSSPSAAGSGPSPSAADPGPSPSAADLGSSPSAVDPGPSPSAADPCSIPSAASTSPAPSADPTCPCRRKCPRRGHCEECRAFHRDQKPGVPPVCEKKGRKKT